jgi:hypothetical protein
MSNGINKYNRCQPFTDRREQCHSIYGNKGEECLNEELTEKRCLSLQHCPKQAKEYYGDVVMTGTSTTSSTPSYLYHKGLCASWAEHFAYRDELQFGTKVVEHHRNAQQIVNNDKKLKLECRAIAFQLAQCIRSKRLFEL